MRIIVISGKAQSGKDTSASMLKEAFEKRGDRTLITHFADLLKYVCKTYLGWDGQKDERGRKLLQEVGTEVFRKNDPDIWVKFVISILNNLGDNWDWVIIPDARFPNEVELLRDSGFDTTHFHIIRNNKEALPESQQKHISETAMDNYKSDVTILNYGTLDDLRSAINKIIIWQEEKAWKNS